MTPKLQTEGRRTLAYEKLLRQHEKRGDLVILSRKVRTVKVGVITYALTTQGILRKVKV